MVSLRNIDLVMSVDWRNHQVPTARTLKPYSDISPCFWDGQVSANTSGPTKASSGEKKYLIQKTYFYIVISNILRIDDGQISIVHCYIWLFSQVFFQKFYWSFVFLFYLIASFLNSCQFLVDLQKKKEKKKNKGDIKLCKGWHIKIKPFYYNFIFKFLELRHLCNIIAK